MQLSAYGKGEIFMQRNWFAKIISIVLMVSLLLSIVVIPVSAGGPGDGGKEGDEAAFEKVWENFLKELLNSDRDDDPKIDFEAKG